MQDDYVTKKDLKRVEDKVDDIKDNHLDSIYASIQFILKDISNLRWFIMGSIGVIAIIVTIAMHLCS